MVINEMNAVCPKDMLERVYKATFFYTIMWSPNINPVQFKQFHVLVSSFVIKATNLIHLVTKEGCKSSLWSLNILIEKVHWWQFLGSTFLRKKKVSIMNSFVIMTYHIEQNNHDSEIDHTHTPKYILRLRLIAKSMHSVSSHSSRSWIEVKALTNRTIFKIWRNALESKVHFKIFLDQLGGGYMEPQDSVFQNDSI